MMRVESIEISSQRLSTLPRPKTVRIDVTCRFSPSSVSRGKKSQPWRRMIAPANPRASVASSGRNTSTPGAMSGSFATTFGLAW
ncbi:hypothetical protein BFL37_05680 [Clavibacter michiganensis]|uniref:Uncharacterized protein n=1 Tax=Clavibacter michiganensis TaxID=28447 RepID=A0A251YNX6_9MICO|nr:hypothetical protein BFL37_05680 [Clavibacter michiganensis]